MSGYITIASVEDLIIDDRNDGDGGAHKKPVPAKRPAVDEAAFYGLAGEIAETIDPYSEADLVATLVNTLVAFGNVIGSGAHALVNKDEHHMNLFVVQVGQSSKARKGLAWSMPRHAFKLIDKSWGEKCIKGGLSTGEGLVSAVRDARYEKRPIREKGRTIDYETVMVDEGVEDKRLLCVEEEFFQALKVMSREGNILSDIVRPAWDGHRLAPMTKNNKIEATDAHISILGHITRDELLRHLTDTEQANGFANRFIWLYLERSKYISNPTGVPDEILEPLIDRLRDAVDFARKTTLIRRDDNAEALWDAGYRGLSSEKPGLVGSITARGEAQAMRLACIYALLDKSPAVRAEHLEAALALWEYSEKCAHFIFGDSQGDPTVDRILAGLKQGPMTETEIRDLFSRHNSAEVDRALSFIFNKGMAKPEIEQTGGRPRTIWKLCPAPKPRGDISDKSDIRDNGGKGDRAFVA
jgi:Protein of unknown function (DUF3987)